MQKKRIIEIKDKYYKAQDNYKSFSESGRSIFDPYSGQNVIVHILAMVQDSLKWFALIIKDKNFI
ncbi:hypothetical protein J11TS1_36390 [Oceanobacillus sp. J11TS1]|nr:hypothetical protein J11TS1_36390 [Oceanobacillus sp. J11TS1]